MSLYEPDNLFVDGKVESKTGFSAVGPMGKVIDQTSGGSLGNVANPGYFAFKFNSGSFSGEPLGVMVGLSTYLRSGDSGQITLSIRADDAGSPDGLDIAALDSFKLPVNEEGPQLIALNLLMGEVTTALVPNTDYWVVCYLNATLAAGSYVKFANDGGARTDVTATSSNGTAWSTHTGSGVLTIYGFGGAEVAEFVNETGNASQFFSRFGSAMIAYSANASAIIATSETREAIRASSRDFNAVEAVSFGSHSAALKGNSYGDGGVGVSGSVTYRFPIAAPSTTPSSSGGTVPAGTYLYAATYVTDYGESLLGDATQGDVLSGSTSSDVLSNIPIGPAEVTGRNIYRSHDAGVTWGIVHSIANNTATTWTDVGASESTAPPVSDGSLLGANGTGVTGTADGSAVAVRGQSLGHAAAGEFSSPDHVPQLRLVPSGISGAPTDGAHVAGELSLDKDSLIHVCIADGSPGTWKAITVS